MSLSLDLLDQANHLLHREPKHPRQASLRRAISAAYYALFHLLIYEASRIFVKDEDTIGMLARSYTHGEMLEVSKKFAQPDLSGLPKKLLPLRDGLRDAERKIIIDKLRSIAQTFVDLQEARHEADYNLRRKYTPEEADKLVKLAERAFSDWKLVRNDDLARIYLSCFLVSKAWDKER